MEKRRKTKHGDLQLLNFAVCSNNGTEVVANETPTVLSSPSSFLGPCSVTVNGTKGRAICINVTEVESGSLIFSK